jgi:hypothetical protein
MDVKASIEPAAGTKCITAANELQAHEFSPR